MLKSKIFQALLTLNSVEMRQFNEFVHSPYFNKNEKLVLFSDYLLQQYPDFNDNKLNKKIIFKKIFPKKTYDDLKMRHLQSMLFKLLEQFFVVQHSLKGEKNSQIKLLAEFRQRGLTKPFHGLEKKIRKAQEEYERRGLGYYYRRFQFGVELESFYDQYLTKNVGTHLQEVSDNLDVFYIVNKLKQSCAVYSYKNIFKQDFNLKFIDELLLHLKENDYPNTLIQLYYSGLLTLIEPDESAHFQKLKGLLIEEQESIPIGVAQDLHTLARNYAINRANKGHEVYKGELFDLYKTAIEEGLLENATGQFPASSYKNIVSIGLAVQEYDFTEKFIKKYSKKLEEEEQSDQYHHSLARLHFSKGDYEKTIDLINRIDFKDPRIIYSTKVLLMKTYYELEEIDALEYLIDSFKQMISRKKNTTYYGKGYMAVIKGIRKLIRLNPYDKKSIEKLKAQIAKDKINFERSWLLEKLAKISA